MAPFSPAAIVLIAVGEIIPVEIEAEEKVEELNIDPLVLLAVGIIKEVVEFEATKVVKGYSTSELIGVKVIQLSPEQEVVVKVTVVSGDNVEVVKEVEHSSSLQEVSVEVTVMSLNSVSVLQEVGKINWEVVELVGIVVVVGSTVVEKDVVVVGSIEVGSTVVEQVVVNVGSSSDVVSVSQLVLTVLVDV